MVTRTTREQWEQHILEFPVLKADVDELRLEMEHDSEIYPDSTDLTCAFIAGNPANTWSVWAEVVDDTAPVPVSLSSKFATQSGHVSGALIEDLSHKDKRYELCMSYGDGKVCIFRHRFLSGEVRKLAAVQIIRVRAGVIPAGETIYGRMKCEQALATCEVSFRYHHHPS